MRTPLALCALLLSCDPGKAPGSSDVGDDSGAQDVDGDGYTTQDGDCDDDSAGVHPGASERCNDRDDDCDGQVDEDPVDAATWYPDQDGDGFVGEAGAVVACAPPSTGTWGDYVQDCHDGDAAVHPGAAEVCNGLDDDCDPATSEAGMVAVGGVAHATVQGAVDAAERGETVWICEGAWAGPVVVGQSMTLRGTGADAVVIEADDTGPVLSVQAGTVALVGLSLVGGAAVEGAGISAADAAELSLDGVVVRDGLGAEACGGIAGPRAGRLSLVDSRVSGHDLRTRGDGGCVCAEELELVGSELSACAAGRGGGAFVTGSATLDEASRIHENLALVAGGGLYLDGADLVGGVVHDNAALDGGGLAGAGTVEGTELRDNGAQGRGGGMLVVDETVLEAVAIRDNEARTGGGGLWLEEEARAFVSDASFSGNEPGDVGAEAGEWTAPGSDFFCTAGGCE